ncbi:transposase [uncultured Amnibacterium sp.]|uniref:transposase n=1 Tax=uncultured Amnibacterium sp. TaxID=1631851 RepID=UPI0035C975C9
MRQRAWVAGTPANPRRTSRACLLTRVGGMRERCWVVRGPVLSDAQWARIEPLMPVPAAGGGRPFREHRQVVEAIIWRYRAGAPWRDLPESFGSWKTAWKRHRRFSDLTSIKLVPR